MLLVGHLVVDRAGVAGRAGADVLLEAVVLLRRHGCVTVCRSVQRSGSESEKNKP